MTPTAPGATLTLARGSSDSTDSPNPSASRHPAGAGSEAASSMSVTLPSSPPAPSAERITSRPPVAGTSPISEISSSLRSSSRAKAGGASGAAAATVVASVIRPSGTIWRTISWARKRPVSSGAAPESVTFSPSVAICAQSSPAASRAPSSSAAVAPSNHAVGPPGDLPGGPDGGGEHRHGKEDGAQAHDVSRAPVPDPIRWPS